ncbi:hypothetical protein [Streptomyces sp. NPDC005336]|uniref:hypothetical protein n=1 Tax=Streptomyces sp. NPDC005336 TaxID=3157035 RepID=UPI0033BAF02D
MVAYSSAASTTATFGIAFYSIVASLIVGLMVMVLSVLTLLWHAVTLILIILLPLVATLGIHPSQQKLLKGWLETFIHAFVLRAGFGVILTILLVLYQMILPAQIALGMQLLLLLLVTVAMVMMLKKLLSGGFSPKVAGAEDMLGVRDMAEAPSGKLVDKAHSGVSAAAPSAGRVAGRAALGSAKAADKKLLGGRLHKLGAFSQSAREQRKQSYEMARNTHAYTEAQEPQPPVERPTGRRRVSSSTGGGASQQPASQQPAPQQPAPQQPQPRPQQPQPSAPQPPQPPPQPQQPEQRGPNGRMS